jgi:hypothetical protein
VTRKLLACVALLPLIAAAPLPNRYDESVFVRNPLAAGQREKLLYVWTRDGDSKESDFIAVVDADQGSATYGKILSTAPTNSGANEAHHFGYNADASRIIGAGMMTN